jgi:hypothetical protein
VRKELRLVVLDEVLDRNTNYWINCPLFMRSGQKIPSICKVSSQLYDEAMPIWMANNTFKFWEIIYPYYDDRMLYLRSERPEKYRKEQRTPHGDLQ